MVLLALGLHADVVRRPSTPPYWYVAMCLVLMAAGVGAAMPSLSSGIVQSVPMNKAGVGSAVNDTTREVGGAIGIAALGSIVNSIYRDHLAPALVPAAARGAGGRQPQRGRCAPRGRRTRRHGRSRGRRTVHHRGAAVVRRRHPRGAAGGCGHRGGRRRRVVATRIPELGTAWLRSALTAIDPRVRPLAAAGARRGGRAAARGRAARADVRGGRGTVGCGEDHALPPLRRPRGAAPRRRRIGGAGGRDGRSPTTCAPTWSTFLSELERIAAPRRLRRRAAHGRRRCGAQRADGRPGARRPRSHAVEQLSRSAAIGADATATCPTTSTSTCCTSQLVGPLFYRRFFSRQAYDPAFVPALVDQVLHTPSRTRRFGAPTGYRGLPWHRGCRRTSVSPCSRCSGGGDRLRRRRASAVAPMAVPVATVMWPILRPGRGSALPYRCRWARRVVERRSPTSARRAPTARRAGSPSPRRAPAARVSPSARPHTARTCCSNWLVTHASSVQWPLLCGRGASSLTSTSLPTTNISTAHHADERRARSAMQVHSCGGAVGAVGRHVARARSWCRGCR